MGRTSIQRGYYKDLNERTAQKEKRDYAREVLDTVKDIEEEEGGVYYSYYNH
jgi:hypothetical protein